MIATSSSSETSASDRVTVVDMAVIPDSLGGFLLATLQLLHDRGPDERAPGFPPLVAPLLNPPMEISIPAQTDVILFLALHLLPSLLACLCPLRSRGMSPPSVPAA